METILTIIGLAFAWKLFGMFGEFMKKITTVEERPYEVQTISEEELASESLTPESIEYDSKSLPLDSIAEEGSGSYTAPYHSIMDEDDLEIERLGGGRKNSTGIDASFIHEAIQTDLKKAIILKEILDRKY